MNTFTSALMNTPADRGKLFKLIHMFYGLMGLQFSDEAAPMGAHPETPDYFLVPFTADF